MTLSRQEQRKLLSRFGEVAVVAVLGRVPRTARREAGKIYGHAAYRKMHEIETGWKYSNRNISSAIVEWIVKEATNYVNAQAATSNQQARLQDSTGVSGSGEEAPQD